MGLNETGTLFLRCAADFTDHDDRFGVRLRFKQAQHFKMIRCPCPLRMRP
jgi:hypothetical protein